MRSDRLKQFHVRLSESIEAAAGKVQSANGAVAMDERHGANGLQAFGAKNADDFTGVSVELSAARKARLSGDNGAAGGRVFQGYNGVRLEDVLVGREIEGVNSQRFRSRIKKCQAGVVVVDDAFERRNNAREELWEFAAADEHVVDFEKHAEAVALARKLLLVGLGSFQVERVIYRHRHLAGHALHELKLGIRDALRYRVPEA